MVLPREALQRPCCRIELRAHDVTRFKARPYTYQLKHPVRRWIRRGRPLQFAPQRRLKLLPCGWLDDIFRVRTVYDFALTGQPVGTMQGPVFVHQTVGPRRKMAGIRRALGVAQQNVPKIQVFMGKRALFDEMIVDRSDGIPLVRGQLPFEHDMKVHVDGLMAKRGGTIEPNGRHIGSQSLNQQIPQPAGNSLRRHWAISPFSPQKPFLHPPFHFLGRIGRYTPLTFAPKCA